MTVMRAHLCSSMERSALRCAAETACGSTSRVAGNSHVGKRDQLLVELGHQTAGWSNDPPEAQRELRRFAAALRTLSPSYASRDSMPPSAYRR
jgi:hypothetical protein